MRERPGRSKPVIAVIAAVARVRGLLAAAAVLVAGAALAGGRALATASIALAGAGRRSLAAARRVIASGSAAAARVIASGSAAARRVIAAGSAAAASVIAAALAAARRAIAAGSIAARRVIAAASVSARRVIAAASVSARRVIAAASVSARRVIAAASVSARRVIAASRSAAAAIAPLARRVVAVGARVAPPVSRAAARAFALAAHGTRAGVEAARPTLRALVRAARRRGLTLPRVKPRTRLRIAVLIISFTAAVIASAYNEGSIAGFPPHHRASGLQIADATAHIQVDFPGVGLANRRAEPADVNGMIQRTDYVGRLIVTPPVLADIARRAGIPADEIGGIVRMTGDVPLALTEPDSERRASDIAESKLPYKLEVQSRPTTPILDINVEAPDLESATKIADLAMVSVRAWMTKVADQQGLLEDSIPALRELGPARGGVVNHKAPVVVGGITFVTVFGLVAAALFGLIRLLAPAPRRRTTAAEEAIPTDNWPHTGRIVPWMLAFFLFIVYVTPFSEIQLNISLPIDMKLDRMILPLVIIPWVLSMAAGGPGAPRLRLTRIHVAIAVFVAIAFLSVTLDARYLNHTQELMLSLKQLPLLVSYVSLFLIASTLRRAEVGAFLKLVLALAIVCSLGMIIEYRFKQNLFYSWSDKLLPGFFTVSGILPGGAVDELGRRLVRGPAEVSLEAVTMLALALPIALVGILHAKRMRARLYYSFAAAILLAAMVATYRKSGFLAPVAIVLTLAYFRRRELLKLAPLFMIMVVLISALSPGAMGSVISQFTRSDRSQVSTVSDRASDYDAVRPDVFSHIAFGRGWGSYNHESYRILDSEILHRVLEVGVLGLISFLMVMVAVVLAVRKTIDLRHPRWSPPALVCAAGAVAFIVVAMLYDVLSFAHGTYAFLFLAGLATVVSDVPAGSARRLRPSGESRTRPARRPDGTRGSAEPARRVRSAPAHAPATAPRSFD